MVAPESRGRLLSGLRREYLDELKAGGRAPETITNYATRLEYFERQMGVTALGEVSRQAFVGFLNGVREGTLPDSRKAGEDTTVAHGAVDAGGMGGDSQGREGDRSARGLGGRDPAQDRCAAQ